MYKKRTTFLFIYSYLFFHIEPIDQRQIILRIPTLDIVFESQERIAF
jgi:hypothetical protein